MGSNKNFVQAEEATDETMAKMDLRNDGPSGTTEGRGWKEFVNMDMTSARSFFDNIMTYFKSMLTSLGLGPNNQSLVQNKAFEMAAEERGVTSTSELTEADYARADRAVRQEAVQQMQEAKRDAVGAFFGRVASGVTHTISGKEQAASGTKSKIGTVADAEDAMARKKQQSTAMEAANVATAAASSERLKEALSDKTGKLKEAIRAEVSKARADGPTGPYDKELVSQGGVRFDHKEQGGQSAEAHKSAETAIEFQKQRAEATAERAQQVENANAGNFIAQTEQRMQEREAERIRRRNEESDRLGGMEGAKG